MIVIYQTYRNSDMTEGRGPMIPDRAFLKREDAEKYIDDKPGIMGRKCSYENSIPIPWSKSKSGDWEIRKIQVF